VDFTLVDVNNKGLFLAFQQLFEKIEEKDLFVPQ
jgi:hypothetical protein